MTQREYEHIFTGFLSGYWGAFHELLEAESVKPERLADSLVRDVVDEHEKFAAICPDGARAAVDELGSLWRQVTAHRVNVPDDPLKAGQVQLALNRFRGAYDALYALGKKFPAARARVLEHAPHGTPKTKLRADAAS